MEATPVIILVDPQMGENIGASARAMMNCGLTDLRLVRPRDGWPSEPARAMSAGALDKMPPVPVYNSVAEAVADCHYVYATTARPREIVKPSLGARDAAADMIKRSGQKIGILFGAERAGLTNEDVAMAHCIITIPLNPEFSSLNLGQAVLLTAYEWRQAQEVSAPPMGDHVLAPHEKLNELFLRLESELEAHDFFKAPELRAPMMRNLRAMLSRGEMSEQEVRTFHGIISALTGKKKK